MTTCKLVQPAANGSGMLLALALLGQLIGTGDSFSIAPTAAPRGPAAWAASRRGPVLIGAGAVDSFGYNKGVSADASPRRGGRVAAPLMSFNAPTHHFPSILEDPMALLRAVPLPRMPFGVEGGVATVHESQAKVLEEASADDEKFQAAALSSKLTLDFYFANLRRSSGQEGTRFDELSKHSDPAALLKYATDRDIGLDASAGAAEMYDSIVKALHSGSSALKTRNKGANKRIERFVEYGKLNRMPNCEASSEPTERDIRSVLQTYGVKAEGNMHFALEHILGLMGLKYSTDYTVHNGEMYIDLILEGGEGGSKFLVSARDKKSFNEGTQEVSNYCKMKSAKVRGIGYTLVAVPYFEWDRLETNGEKAAYLAGKLSRAGFFGEAGQSATRVKEVMRGAHAH